MRRRYHRYQGDPTLRANLVKAFAMMRKEGFIARADFSCCGSCAGYEIATAASAMADRGKFIKGCVFWTRQDEANGEEAGMMYISYGKVSTEKHGDIGLEDAEVAKIFIEKLKAVELEYEWDGDPRTRILVYVGADPAKERERERARKEAREKYEEEQRLANVADEVAKIVEEERDRLAKLDAQIEADKRIDQIVGV